MIKFWRKSNLEHKLRIFKIVILKHKMKGLQIPQKLGYEKVYVHGITAGNLSKIYFLKNAKKTCKPNNRDLNRDWMIHWYSSWIDTLISMQKMRTNK